MRLPPRQMNSAHGFTLMELAIVLVVIALVVGGVVAGQSIVRSSELSSVRGDVVSFSDAIAKFEEHYGGLPGDLPNATGFNLGGIIGPLLFGWIMDQQMPHWVFGASAAFMILTVLLALVPEPTSGSAAEEPVQGILPS